MTAREASLRGESSPRQPLLGSLTRCQASTHRAVIQPSLFICHHSFISVLDKHGLVTGEQVRWALPCGLMLCWCITIWTPLDFSFSHPVCLLRTPCHELMWTSMSCAQGLAVISCKWCFPDHRSKAASTEVHYLRPVQLYIPQGSTLPVESASQVINNN